MTHDGNCSTHPDKLEFVGGMENGKWRMENEVSRLTKAFCIFHLSIIHFPFSIDSNKCQFVGL